MKKILMAITTICLSFLSILNVNALAFSSADVLEWQEHISSDITTIENKINEYENTNYQDEVLVYVKGYSKIMILGTNDKYLDAKKLLETNIVTLIEDISGVSYNIDVNITNITDYEYGPDEGKLTLTSAVALEKVLQKIELIHNELITIDETIITSLEEVIPTQQVEYKKMEANGLKTYFNDFKIKLLTLFDATSETYSNIEAIVAEVEFAKLDETLAKDSIETRENMNTLLDESIMAIKTKIGLLRNVLYPYLNQSGLEIENEVIDIETTKDSASIAEAASDILELIDLKTSLEKLISLESTYGETTEMMTINLEDLKSGINSLITYLAFSNISTLSNVLFNNGQVDLIPLFIGGKYHVEVENELATGEIKVTKDNPDSVVTYNGNTNNLVNLDYGLNLFNIVVTPQRGNATTYILEVFRKLSTNNNISKVEINGVEVLYNAIDNRYYLDVENSVKVANIAVTPESTLATTSYLTTLNLTSGLNSATLRVIAQDGSIKDYDLVIHRELNSDKRLKQLKVGTKSLKYKESATNYNVTVSSSTKKIAIKATPTEATTIVDGTGIFNLKTGKNIFKLEIVAEDGTSKYINVNVTRLKAKKVVPVVEEPKEEPKKEIEEPKEEEKVEENKTGQVIAVSLLIVGGLTLVGIFIFKKETK